MGQDHIGRAMATAGMRPVIGPPSATGSDHDVRSYRIAHVRPVRIGGHTLLLNSWDQGSASPCDPYEFFILVIMQLQLPVVGMFQRLADSSGQMGISRRNDQALRS